MFEDPFASAVDSVTAPASDCFQITPDDTNDLSQATKALYVGTGGNIVLRSVGSENDVTLRNVVGGSIIDIRTRAVRATGTTASDIVGLA